jgi:hypothetical protein
MWLALSLWISTPAAAGGPWVMPEGSATVYGGVGASTFAVGLNGLRRDRQLGVRAVGYAAVGLPGELEASLSLPLVGNFVVDDPSEGPCPSPDDYCADTASLGTVTVELRRQVLSGPVPLAVGVGLYGDPWNAAQRGRWTNVGQGIVGAGLTAACGLSGDVGGSVLGVDLAAGWWPTVGRSATSASGATRRAPVGPVTGRLDAWARHRSVTAGVAGQAQQRLGGIPYGGEWVQEWRASEDRWGVTRFGELRLEGKLSWAFADGWGLHGSVSRTVVVLAGPPDVWDAGLGVHRYWAPRDD